jgi:hypothetical protein
MNIEQKMLAEKIMSYLGKNPNAGDTTDGIAKWWLESGNTPQQVKQVANVLEILTREGLIRKRQLYGGTTLYKIGKPIKRTGKFRL